MSIFAQDRISFFLNQSVQDTPCRVRLAGRESLFSISKWGGEATLVFAPGGEHEGDIEISRNELLLKPSSTPKAHHVFRKLDGDRFEYDVVLLKEPDSNAIVIDLDFPEGLEFYRQPTLDDVRRHHVACAPNVIESYAVYWKESHNQYKTGKFCHIYRPLVYDARGRTVWGRLDLRSKQLTITIPVDWLADAAYPVIVDPIIGTQTVGANRQIDWSGGGNPADFKIEQMMAVTKFLASSTPIQGFCRTYLYSYLSGNYSAQPVIYSDSGNKPYRRASQQEALVNCGVSTPGWVQSTFVIYPGVYANTGFWFGFNTPGAYYTYFDYASTMYRMVTANLTEPPTSFIDSFSKSWNVRMSAYIEYGLPQAYQRTVAQYIGAGVVDPGRLMTIERQCVDAEDIIESHGNTSLFYRYCPCDFQVQNILGFFGVFVRQCVETVSGVLSFIRRLDVSRKIGSCLTLLETLKKRLCLMKEEAVIVSRVTREIEFKGYLI